MRKIYLLVVAALAAVGFTSCEKGNDDVKVVDSDLVGTWAGEPDVSPHYPIVTFQDNGNYVWVWDGIHKHKDLGTYSFSGNEIKMNIAEYYQQDYSGSGELVKVDSPLEYGGVRTCKVVSMNPGVLSIVVFDDYYMGTECSFILFREGLEQSITVSDLNGTWETFDEGGSVNGRIVVNQGNYTMYTVWSDSNNNNQLAAYKLEGTISIERGFLTMSPTNQWNSFRTGVDQHQQTTYTFYTVNPQTFEAEQWVESDYPPRVTSTKVYLSEGKLYTSMGVLYKK